MAKNISRSQILRKVLATFNKRGVDYVIVGAAALVVHGLPRTTLDLDLYVPARQDILSKIFDSLAALRLESDQQSILALADRPHLFKDQWICFSSGQEDILDIYLACEDDFNKLRKGSTVMQSQGLPIRVASLNDIEIMKRAANRPVDKADLELIKEAKRLKGKRGGA